MEKFCNCFRKTWEKFCRNVKVGKTSVTLGKKLKKYLKIFKKIMKEFRRNGNKLLDKFSTHFGRNFM